MVRWGKIRRMVPFIPSYMDVQVVNMCLCFWLKIKNRSMIRMMMMMLNQREMAEEAAEEGKEARLSLLVTDLQVL